MYKNGIGVEQNISRAIKWFRRSADQGNCVGQHELGLAYWYGVGVQQDFTRALKWIRLAADQGDTKAQLAMGSAYMGGHGGLSIDKHEAFLWYLRAATLGDPSGQYNTGLRYFAGDGVTQDADAAEKWFELAANQGHSKALKHLAQARMMKR